MTINNISIAYLFVCTALMLFLPRRWAPIPLLAGACYMTLGQGITIGQLNFPIIRLVIAVGLARLILRRERLAGGLNVMDWLMLALSALALISSIFHKDPSSALIFRLGLSYNVCGVYFLLRVFCQSIEDVKTLCLIIAILLIPVAIAMVYEKIAINNLFSIFGGVPDIPEIRQGKVRASGPFVHPILAGTIGAACIPLMIGIWKTNKNIAVIGFVACLSMIFSSTSSGPIMSTVMVIAALFMWHYRQHMRLVRWLAVLGYIAFDIVMKAPVYYIFQRIDLVGGSTGYHRAALIETALNHLDEWWMWGTDYTRHWMPTGVPWSQDHTDITNYYLHFGIIGGLPLMLMFIAILYKGFSFVGKAVGQASNYPPEARFLIWALGSSLFGHSVTFLSVSYFDQSFIFIYLTLASISSIGTGKLS